MTRSRILLGLAVLCLAVPTASAQVHDLAVLATGSKSSAKMDPPWVKIDLDLNLKAGGKYIYLFKDRASRKKGYITDLAILEGETTQAPAGWQKVQVDLNQGAGGAFLWLAFKRSLSAQGAIRDVSVVTGGTREEALAQRTPGWQYLNTDLNKNAGGRFIFLTYRK